MWHIIYKTTNLVNNKIYIGKQSCKNLKNNYLGSGPLLKKAIKKHGKHNFKKEIIHYCNSENEAYELERNIVNEDFVIRNDTYNIKIGGKGNKNVSQDTKDKISESLKSWHKLNPYSEDDITKFSNAHKGEKHHFYGKSLSEEHKLNLSKSHLGISNGNHTNQTKLKMSKSHKGKILTEEHKQKISKSQIGKKVSESQKEKVSIKVICEKGILHSSLTSCAIYYNVSKVTISRWLKSNNKNFKIL